jgi:hypothetical protein
VRSVVCPEAFVAEETLVVIKVGIVQTSGNLRLALVMAGDCVLQVVELAFELHNLMFTLSFDLSNLFVRLALAFYYFL